MLSSIFKEIRSWKPYKFDTNKKMAGRRRRDRHRDNEEKVEIDKKKQRRDGQKENKELWKIFEFASQAASQLGRRVVFELERICEKDPKSYRGFANLPARQPAIWGGEWFLS